LGEKVLIFFLSIQKLFVYVPLQPKRELFYIHREKKNVQN